MAAVEVFLFTSRNPADIEPAIRLFRSGPALNFTVHLLPLPEPTSIDADTALVQAALGKAAIGTYAIVCKDVVISTASSETIAEVISTAILDHESGTHPFDLFYLSKWMDRCDQYFNGRDVGETGLQIVDTLSPYGVQCLLFSPAGRSKFASLSPPGASFREPLSVILNRQIRARPPSGDLFPDDIPAFVAITTYPTLIQFDMQRRQRDNEMLKTVDCRDVPSSTPLKSTPGENMGVFWFLVIVVIVVILAVVIIRISSRLTGGSAGYSAATMHPARLI